MNNRIYCEKSYKKALKEYLVKLSKQKYRLNKIKKVFNDEFK
jgi:hypothetical protein